MEPSSKKRKLAPKVNTSVAPNPQPAAQYSHETVSLASPQPLDHLTVLPCCHFSPSPSILLSIAFFATRIVANIFSSIFSRHNNSPTPYTMLPLPNDKTSRPLRVICRMLPC